MLKFEALEDTTIIDSSCTPATANEIPLCTAIVHSDCDASYRYRGHDSSHDSRKQIVLAEGSCFPAHPQSATSLMEPGAASIFLEPNIVESRVFHNNPEIQEQHESRPNPHINHLRSIEYQQRHHDNYALKGQRDPRHAKHSHTSRPGHETEPSMSHADEDRPMRYRQGSPPQHTDSWLHAHMLSGALPKHRRKSRCRPVEDSSGTGARYAPPASDRFDLSQNCSSLTHKSGNVGANGSHDNSSLTQLVSDTQEAGYHAAPQRSN